MSPAIRTVHFGHVDDVADIREIYDLIVCSAVSVALLMSESPLAPTAPSPLHIIRSHNAAINALFVSGDNERIYSGDVSGLVVITSTRSIRPLASWKAHTDGLLGIEEWGEQQVITSVCGSSRILWEGEDDVLTWSLFHVFFRACFPHEKATVATTSCTCGNGPRMPHPLSAADLRRPLAR